MGLIIDPPDVTVSRIRWAGKNRRLRVGLMAIGGLGQNSMERIVNCRRRSHFKGMDDFLDRVQPAEDEARALIHCGALDKLDTERSRTRLLWRLIRWQSDRRQTGVQTDLFAAHNGKSVSAPQPVFPPTDATARLRRQFAVLGFLCDCHPITLFADTIRLQQTVNANQLPKWVGRRVRLAAWLVTGKTVHTRNGDPMEFLTFEDETGIVETTFFPAAYRRFCHRIDRNRPYLLKGKVETNWGAITLTVDGIETIEPA
jgi:DNA polymerase-3 subunit alpha/error-prone DNA polymerase